MKHLPRKSTLGLSKIKVPGRLNSKIISFDRHTKIHVSVSIPEKKSACTFQNYNILV